MTVYLGIDTTAGNRPVTLAALDERLNVLHLGDHPLDEALAHVAVYEEAVCGVDAPIGENRGLMADPTYRERLGLPPRGETYSSFRVGEYEARRRGIYIYNTPTEREEASDWMQEGWRIYDQLRALGFLVYPQWGTRRMFETYPHGIYTVLLERRPYPKTCVEGRIQRQLLLYEHGVDIPDPMHAMEEWTRHHFLRGTIHLEKLYLHDALDALAAAYTAYVLDRDPGRITMLGDPTEGQILLPTGNLAESYE